MARVLPKADSITIKKEELDQLDMIVQSIPAGYALGVIDMFRLINHNRVKEAQAERKPLSELNQD